MKPDNTSGPSESEQRCQQQFDTWLRSRQLAISLLWEYIPVSVQPPDYFLTLGSHKYAVEVTLLVPELELKGEFVSESSIINPLFDWGRKFRQRALDSNTLVGNYMLTLPGPIEDFSKARRRLEREIKEYIEQTTLLDTCDSLEIRAGGQVVCKIAKIDNNSNWLHITGFTRICSLEEACSELRQLLYRKLLHKAQRLKGVHIPIVLVLDYVWALFGPEILRECLPSQAELEAFHAIYVVWGNDGFLLHGSDFFPQESG